MGPAIVNVKVRFVTVLACSCSISSLVSTYSPGQGPGGSQVPIRESTSLHHQRICFGELRKILKNKSFFRVVPSNYPAKPNVGLLHGLNIM